MRSMCGMHAITHQEIQDFDFKIPRHASTFLRPKLFDSNASVVLVPLATLPRFPLLLLGLPHFRWQVCLASPTLWVENLSCIGANYSLNNIHAPKGSHCVEQKFKALIILRMWSRLP